MEISFVWLEITGKCQLECTHCYASSGPSGDYGTMAEPDWRGVIDEAEQAGTRMVQFIGGEPTLNPSLPNLIQHAVGRSVAVEVFTNLVHVTPELWETFGQPGVQLATSYYSDDPGEHQAITRRPTHERTKAGIREAVRRSIPLRVGVIDLHDEQRSTQAVDELRALGVTEIGTDRLRQVGRGIRDQQASLDQLCGHCGDGKIAVSPIGDVWPCVFSRWMPVGNVRDARLCDILTGAAMRSATAQLRAEFGPPQMPCVPKMCDPQCGPTCSPACEPQCWPTRSGPCKPRGGCRPNYEKR